jgi:hypothetical protein
LASTKKTDQTLERNRTRWDKIRLSLLILPLLFCYIFTPFTSLAALVLVVLKWKAPGSMVSNTRVRLIVFGVVALLEFVGSCLIWWMAFGRSHTT